MNVCLYLRYSSNRQTEQSIEGQDRVCREFCRREGHTVVASYIDRAASASHDTAKRTEFLRMIKDSEKGKFDAVVVYALDRFARNRYDSATYKAKLTRNGVRLISATQLISEEPEGIILEAVLEGMAEYYSKELSQKVTRGMRESAYKGNSTGGTIPLGYKIVDKKYTIDERTAPIIREIFERYASGDSIRSITDDLNERGFRNARGKPFNKSSLANIFKNRKYIGEFVFDDIVVPGAVPAIVSKELFESCQTRVAAVKRAPGRNKAEDLYLLSGKIFCGHCGAPMIGSSAINKYQMKYSYYACRNQRFEKTCDKKTVRKEDIEVAVLRAAYENLTPEKIDEIAEQAVALNEDDEKEEMIRAEEQYLAELKGRASNLVKLLSYNPDVPSALEELTQVEEERRAAEMRLAELKKEHIHIEKDHVVWYLTTFLEGDLDDPAYRKSFIDMFVNAVYVYDDPDGHRLEIRYNMTDGKGMKTESLNLTSAGSPAWTNTNFFCVVYLMKNRR